MGHLGKDTKREPKNRANRAPPIALSHLSIATSLSFRQVPAGHAAETLCQVSLKRIEKHARYLLAGLRWLAYGWCWCINKK